MISIVIVTLSKHHCNQFIVSKHGRCSQRFKTGDGLGELAFANGNIDIEPSVNPFNQLDW